MQAPDFVTTLCLGQGIPQGQDRVLLAVSSPAHCTCLARDKHSIMFTAFVADFQGLLPG